MKTLGKVLVGGGLLAAVGLIAAVATGGDDSNDSNSNSNSSAWPPEGCTEILRAEYRGHGYAVAECHIGQIKMLRAQVRVPGSDAIDSATPFTTPLAAETWAKNTIDASAGTCTEADRGTYRGVAWTLHACPHAGGEGMQFSPQFAGPNGATVKSPDPFATVAEATTWLQSSIDKLGPLGSVADGRGGTTIPSTAAAGGATQAFFAGFNKG
jgi:hypothetical protein